MLSTRRAVIAYSFGIPTPDGISARGGPLYAAWVIKKNWLLGPVRAHDPSSFRAALSRSWEIGTSLMPLRADALLCLALTASAVAADKTVVRTSGYRVLFDAQPQGLRANTATGVLQGKRLQLCFAGPMEDDEAGTLPYFVDSTDLGHQWGKPEIFATGIRQKIGVSAAQEA